MALEVCQEIASGTRATRLCSKKTWPPSVENCDLLNVVSGLERNSLFEAQNARINQRIAMLYEGLKEPALRRHGETDDKTEELI